MKCSVCNKEIPVGTGRMLVWNDGRTAYYCGSKCRSNVEMGRQAKNINWIRKKQ
jgi:large subunit ribosomal protein L24e